MSSVPPALRRVAPVAAVLGVVLVLAVVVVLVTTRDDTGATGSAGRGTSGSAEPVEPAPTTPLSTPLADLDTTTLTVQRADFCDLVPIEPLEAALGGPPGSVRSYGNGESAALSPSVTDIAHEYGCRWQRGPMVLRAWVFAPPVTSDEADRLVADARSTDGCVRRRGTPDYGVPSLARTCPVGKGFEASYRGLFGDAWLACSLTTRGDRPDVEAQADPWCAAVAQAAAAPPA